MAKLSASLVVDITDKTGQKTKAIIGNMNRLQRAERDLMLADRGAQLSRRDRALERVMSERAVSMEERQRSIATYAARGGAVLAVAGTAAYKAYRSYAEVERRINRILINADKPFDALGPTMAKLQKVAADARMPFDDVATGFEALIASGRSLEDSLAFLPSVAMTAQAAGAATEDMAKTADAMAGSMQIAGAEMQKGFDILVTGGKLGKFELPEMAQYLPSLLPAFAALGYKGTEGLGKIVAMLQVMRNQAGSSGEAATYLGNVLNKMYSDETANKFKKFGIDIRKELDLAKERGEDLIAVFVEMAIKATKGDLSKLPMLFTDAEYQKGMRALISQKNMVGEYTRELRNVDGAAVRDVNKLFLDSASKIQNMSSLWDTFVTQMGGGVADVVNPVLEKTTNAINDMQARRNALKGQDPDLVDNSITEYARRYREFNPEASSVEIGHFYEQALTQVGKGEWKSIFDGLDQRRRKQETIQQYRNGEAPASRGRQNAPIPDMSFPGVTLYPVDKDGKLLGDAPKPTPQPTAESERLERLRDAYRYGTGRERVADSQQRLLNVMRERDGGTSLRPGQKDAVRADVVATAERASKEDAEKESDGRTGFEWLFDRKFWLGKAAKGGSLREHMGFEVTGGALGQKGADTAGEASGDGTKAAEPSGTVQPDGRVPWMYSEAPRLPSLALPDTSPPGMPTVVTNPSGVQQVAITNLPDPVSQGVVNDVRGGNRRGFEWSLDAEHWPGRDPRPPLRDDGAGPAAATGLPPTGETQRPDVADTGPREVSLLGTPTVIAQPSGVQQVQVMNQPPAPQINIGGVTVYATTNASPKEIGDQAANAIGQRVKAALDGVHADTEYSIG